MKRFWVIALVCVVVGAAHAPLFAWEFDMQGEYEYRFRYFARTGDIDLFGNAALQEGIGTFIGFAGPNIYGTATSPRSLATQRTAAMRASSPPTVHRLNLRLWQLHTVSLAAVSPDGALTHIIMIPG